jgi:truncated hemoglobin YjbI
MLRWIYFFKKVNKSNSATVFFKVNVKNEKKDQRTILESFWAVIFIGQNGQYCPGKTKSRQWQKTIFPFM